MTENQTNTPTRCKYCHSVHIIKYGHYKGVQRYYCIDCHRKFVSSDTIPGMWYPDRKVSDAIYMYYEGFSLAAIRKKMLEQDQDYVSRVSIYNWVQKRTQEVKREMEKTQPSVGGVWVFIETFMPINGKDIWIWDIVDTKTKFLLASTLSEDRSDFDLHSLVEKARERVGKYPEILFHNNRDLILSDKNISEKPARGPYHGNLFIIMNNGKFVRHFQNLLEARSKVMRDLKSIKNAEVFLDGWLVHYNYFKPDPLANYKTPAYSAGLNVPRRETLVRRIEQANAMAGAVN